MPLRPVRDFDAAGAVLSHSLGEQVRVNDNSKEGAKGVLDTADTFVKVGGAPVGQVTRVTQGMINDVTLRLAISQAAKDLAKSGARFAGRDAEYSVNKQYWSLGYGGRMQVRKFLPGDKLGSPAAAIRDIFKSGNKYGFECATAMMVIFHKAILDVIGDQTFDRLFTEPRYLAFFRWDIKDPDFEQLECIKYGEVGGLVPGNHYYYKNPDASPQNSAFQGENVVYVGEERGKKMFYGHGVVGARGDYIVTEDELVRSLSALRRAGATTAPFRDAFCYHLDADKLAQLVAELDSKPAATASAAATLDTDKLAQGVARPDHKPATTPSAPAPDSVCLAQVAAEPGSTPTTTSAPSARFTWLLSLIPGPLRRLLT